MKKSLSLILCIAILLTMFCGCGKKAAPAVPMNSGNTQDSPAAAENINNLPENVENPEKKDESGDNSAPDKPDVSTDNGAHPLMWEVSGKNGKGHIYFFGSIHVTDGTLFPLPDAVEKAFAESDSLAVEFDTTATENDVAAQVNMLKTMLLPAGQSVRDIMGDELYEKIKNFLTENDLPFSELYNSYNCYFWSSLVDQVLLEKSGFMDAQGVDSYLLSAAHERGMEIIDIESMEFQLDLLNNVPTELQLAMIESNIDYADSYGDDLYELYEAYCSGDEERILELSEISADGLEEDGFTKEEIAILEKQIDEYNKALITDRNIGMANAAKDYLADGKDVFFVVGIAHMVGEGGIIDLLTDEGYTVTRCDY